MPTYTRNTIANAPPLRKVYECQGLWMWRLQMHWRDMETGRGYELVLSGYAPTEVGAEMAAYGATPEWRAKWKKVLR